MDLQSDPEFVSMFLFHNVEPLEMEGEREVILSKVGQLTVPVRTYIYTSQNTIFQIHCALNIHTYIGACVCSIWLTVLCDV